MKKIIHAKFEKEKAELFENSESLKNSNTTKRIDTIQKCNICSRKFRSAVKFAYHKAFHNEEIQKTRIKNNQTTRTHRTPITRRKNKRKKSKPEHGSSTNKDIPSNHNQENEREKTSKNKNKGERCISYKLKLKKHNKEWTLITLPCLQKNRKRIK